MCIVYTWASSQGSLYCRPAVNPWKCVKTYGASSTSRSGFPSLLVFLYIHLVLVVDLSSFQTFPGTVVLSPYYISSFTHPVWLLATIYVSLPTDVPCIYTIYVYLPIVSTYQWCLTIYVYVPIVSTYLKRIPLLVAWRSMWIVCQRWLYFTHIFEGLAFSHACPIIWIWRCQSSLIHALDNFIVTCIYMISILRAS